MATMILSAAGASIGSATGGALLGIGASTLGKAAGGVAGSLIDQQILGRGGQAVETARIERIRLQGAGEGEAIPRLYGRMRVGGQLIWSSRFREHVDETNQGGKGGGSRTRDYRYSISFAVALCEGPIRGIGRIWADGNEISLNDHLHRVHKGGAQQQSDPLIDDIEGGAPAFRDIAYIVFEEMDLSQFGNRIPQLNIEVWREPATTELGETPRLSELVQGVAMSPGSGEFSLETIKVRRLIGPGRSVFENVNTISERPDLMVALDQLEEEAPECRAVSLIVSWFGDDLRCSRCEIRPAVETDNKETSPENWSVNGIGRSSAKIVSTDPDGRPIFGGTPSDRSVIRAIREMKERGIKVMFYPFILMDVPASNAKPDPWSEENRQPPFPWRGRVTLDRAPGMVGSSDKTSAAGAEVAGFFGAAAATDFLAGGHAVSYNGPSEWSFRRFILHYAHLCAEAGGVDSFCIGSEMRSLTQIRGVGNTYPAVQRLRDLAADVRSILGPQTRIGYAADWSEYFGHQPGGGDVFFHLDPLWADENIDFVGIDNYLPLADWRYRDGHLDEGSKSVYSLDYLGGNVEGGEGFDWYYGDMAAREDQRRTPITDTSHGEHWIFRPKDIRNWWSNAHYDRPGGVRASLPTAWEPGSKPIWFTEIGCPAVDLGANQPNVFVDPKSSENALPYFSAGVRDDFMQRRYLQAVLSHWAKPINNPLASHYDGRMVDLSRTFVWTWDARPWPDFPNRLDVWSDGANYRLGHWISGRLGAASLADVVAEICRRAGLTAFDVSELYGVVHGYVVDDVVSARAALQPLMMAFAFDPVESAGVIRFRHRNRPSDGALNTSDALISDEGGVEITYSRAPESEMPSSLALGYVDGESNYETGAIEARKSGSRSTRNEFLQAPIVLDSAAAQNIVDRQLIEIWAGRESARLVVARRHLAFEVGDIVALPNAPADTRFRIDTIEDRGSRALTLTRIEQKAYAPFPAPVRKPSGPTVFPAPPVIGVFLDLPLLEGSEIAPKIAAFASPWLGSADLFVSDSVDDYLLATRIVRPAVMGVLEANLAKAAPGIWSRGTGARVKLFGGALSAKPDLSVLNGANRAALRSPSGEWELLQFQGAELIGPDLWVLTRLLRGQAGTEPFVGDPTPAGATFVLLDGAVTDVVSAPALRGVTRNWRIGPSRKPYAHDSYTAFVDEDDAVRLRPFAPAHLRATTDRETGAIWISWVRRTRIDGDSWVGIAPPLGEAREAYRLRIGGVREVEVDRPGWLWTAEAKAEDGVAGQVEISVAQISDEFGPGPETKVRIYV
ncbi:MAG: glycoside hydrolase TIM-barrel-like domain-containing protein [Paracoccaceae bacterium]